MKSATNNKLLETRAPAPSVRRPRRASRLFGSGLAKRVWEIGGDRTLATSGNTRLTSFNPFNQRTHARMHLQTIAGQHPFHVETVDLKLREGLKEALVSKACSLFRRHAQLLGVKLRVRREERHRSPSQYSATVQLVLPGYDRIVVKKGERLSSVLSETLEVAGRQLRRRARALRAKKRSQPHRQEGLPFLCGTAAFLFLTLKIKIDNRKKN
eukprot:TRINITY_DN10994_c0_g1_i2.p1 TRINITY_DN10994_c0_g1~~TRINITY_DN10994_c0_g1_i2.p1  ORF type:complete len:241 (-),score=1.91 TRINITY_DN10994_c0_g1_i2:79-714(-)